MATTIKEIYIPDIGGAENVAVIDVAVKPGDLIQSEDTLLTLESDKAAMDIPAPFSGVVQEVFLKTGDQVSEGSLILTLVSSSQNDAVSEQSENPKVELLNTEKIVTVLLPNIGTDKPVKIIEMLVTAGDVLKEEMPILTLESDKAALEVPSPYSGTVESVLVKVGEEVSEGAALLTMKVVEAKSTEVVSPSSSSDFKVKNPEVAPSLANMDYVNTSGVVHAGPSVRRLGFALGVDLTKVKGSGRKNRITIEDVHRYVKSVMTQVNAGAFQSGGLNLLPMPKVDFAKFGAVAISPLSRIKKISGANLHRNWVMIPHVTQFEEADITDMEAFRQEKKAEAEKAGVKLTPIVFIMKAVVDCLKAYPGFNASLDESGENLVLKQYYHIGVAVDTPNGLVVPVIRDVDQKGILELARELAHLSQKAREGKLSAAEMQGGCFSISSLGGIGGTAFTPIINAPEVAILGVSRSEIKAKYISNEFKPRLMLPLSLSYDHRVIDGADAARFVTKLAKDLGDLRYLLF